MCFHKGIENQLFLAKQPGATRTKLFWEMRDKQARKPYQRFASTCIGIFCNAKVFSRTDGCLKALSTQFLSDESHSCTVLTKPF